MKIQPETLLLLAVIAIITGGFWYVTWMLLKIVKAIG